MKLDTDLVADLLLLSDLNIDCLVIDEDSIFVDLYQCKVTYYNDERARFEFRTSDSLFGDVGTCWMWEHPYYYGRPTEQDKDFIRLFDWTGKKINI